MARTLLSAALLAAAVLAVVGPSSVAASSADDAGMDASFLTSWLGLGSDEAAQLASNGASAAARRREMLATAAAGNGFGEQALPGAYEPAGTFTVEFTSLLANQQESTFSSSPRGTGGSPLAKYLSLVVAQARLTGTGKTPTVSTVFIRNRIGKNGAITGLFVRVKVFFADRVGAQLFEHRLEEVPGPRPTWLTAPYGAGSFILPTVSNSVTCTAPLCKVCFNTPSKCATCFDSIGAPGTPQFRTVYKNTKGVCVTCSPNCEKCKPDGTCLKCKPNYNINSKGQCIKFNTPTPCTVPNCNQCIPQPFASKCKLCRATFYPTASGLCCKDPMCANCPRATGTPCTTCRATITAGKKTFTVYKNIRGQCKMCTLPNCNKCAANGTCATCARGYRRTATGTCRRI